MYKAHKHTRQFNLERESDLSAYDELLNNPLCKIINERQVKKTVSEFGEEGQLISREDLHMLIVTWEEKEPI